MNKIIELTGWVIFVVVIFFGLTFFVLPMLFGGFFTDVSQIGMILLVGLITGCTYINVYRYCKMVKRKSDCMKMKYKIMIVAVFAVAVILIIGVVNSHKQKYSEDIQTYRNYIYDTSVNYKMMKKAVKEVGEMDSDEFDYLFDAYKLVMNDLAGADIYYRKCVEEGVIEENSYYKDEYIIYMREMFSTLFHDFVKYKVYNNISRKSFQETYVDLDKKINDFFEEDSIT